MKRSLLLLTLAFSLISFSFVILGGHSLKFDSPGEGFVKSEDGTTYEKVDDNLTLKGNLVSQNYDAFKLEMEERLSAIDEISIFTKGDEKLGPHNGFLIKMTKQVDDENEMIAFVFLFPAGHGMTGNMTATFPASLEENYADAMLKAMGTARVVHQH